MRFSSRKGFTVLELLIFAALFTVIILGFITIMVTVVRVYSRQSAFAEVTQQSQFLLQRIQFFVENSSLVEMPQDAATTTLTLRMADDTKDPTTIRLNSADNAVYLKEGGAAEAALTSDDVKVTELTFVKRSNPPAHDSVNVSLTVENNVDNITKLFTQSFRTAVTRVSAATFDSNVTPSSTDDYTVGTGALRWSSINGVIHFSSADPPNVGVGVAAPGAKFQVSGGDIYVDNAATYGLILRDTDGTCWRIKPATGTGAYSSASTTCP